MNWDSIKAAWHQFREEALQQWAKLTVSEWEGIAGSKEQLVRRLQEHYHWQRDDAETEVNKYFGRASASPRFSPA